MQAVIFTGVQGAGKTTFYRRFLFRTHVRLSLDLLRTRHRESRFLDTCIQTRARFVVDNTNARPKDRARYLVPARKAGYETIACHFSCDVESALRRNRSRAPDEIVPDIAVRGTFRKIEAPVFGEGFDRIISVTIESSGEYLIGEEGRVGVVPFPIFRMGGTVDDYHHL
jgi:predicted kinase